MKRKKTRARTVAQVGKKKKTRVAGGYYTKEGFKRLQLGGKKGALATAKLYADNKYRERHIIVVDDDAYAKWKDYASYTPIVQRWKSLDVALAAEIDNSVDCKTSGVKGGK